MARKFACFTEYRQHSHKERRDSGVVRLRVLKTTPEETPIWKPPSTRELRRANEILLARYGEKIARKRDPLDGMIVIMLSQATNDLNCDRAFTSLKNTFPDWAGVLRAPVEEIANAIRMGGLANQKSARIKQLLQEIYDEQGDLDLSWMQDASVEKCRAFMQRFKGVGPKTIACVLVFFLDKPAFPVDTHVHRVTKRLGWIREKAGTDEAHRVLEEVIPDDCKLNLHVNIIQHGRIVCRATGNGGPKCEECVLIRQCEFARTHFQASFIREVKAPSTPLPVNSDFFVTVE